MQWRKWIPIIITGILTVFLILPVFLSIYAGLSVNYAKGFSSGLTFKWVIEVWHMYADTIWRSIFISIATLGLNLIIGVPGAYILIRRGGRFARIVEEIITLPVAIPGLALALGMILVYGSYSGFRQSNLFIIVGHVLFTLPFMVRAIMAVLETIDWKTLDEGGASLGASIWRRFFDLILPNIRQGIVAGSLTVVTLSIGEFNLTWMMHTPLLKTLPVGLADAYASLRLEIASAYTIIFLIMVIPLLILMQIIANFNKKHTKL